MIPESTLTDAFAADVVRDLQRTPKQLQSRYLYDALGSSLFDAICRLPWYRITRAEARLLRQHAPELATAVPGWLDDPTVVELGCGNGEKIEVVLTALPDVPVDVHLIDISPDALQATAARLAGLSHLSVIRHEAPYEVGLDRVRPLLRARGPALVLFLGSNIGNFDRPVAESLLRSIRHALQPGSALLLGADLVKPRHTLTLAYDDPLGVTAAFNKNLLVRINRELGADFDLDWFRTSCDLERTPSSGSRCTWSACTIRRCGWRRRQSESGSRRGNRSGRKAPTSTPSTRSSLSDPGRVSRSTRSGSTATRHSR